MDNLSYTVVVRQTPIHIEPITNEELTLIDRVREELVKREIKPPAWRDTEPEKRQKFCDAARQVLMELDPNPRTIARRTQVVTDALSGVGILDQLLRDRCVEEIFVRNGDVSVEYDGTFYNLGHLADDSYFYNLAVHVADQGGATLRGDRPAVLVDLPGGERFTAIVPRLSVSGTAINVRTFGRRVRTLEQMQETGTFQNRKTSLDGSLEDIQDPEICARIEALGSGPDRFLAWLTATLSGSLLIAGPMGSGKTSLLNALSEFLPRNAPVSVLETFREMDVRHPFLLRTVAPEELPEGQPGVTMDWVLNVIYTRMNPAAILLGEVVAKEALQFLKAACLGRKAMTTIHGGSVEEALMRLEQLALAAAPELGLPAVRSMVALGLDVVVLMGRVNNGQKAERTLQAVALLDGLDEAGNYRLQYVYKLEGSQEQSILSQAWKTLASNGGRSLGLSRLGG